jgi:acyl-CoA thioester hydrolase
LKKFRHFAKTVNEWLLGKDTIFTDFTLATKALICTFNIQEKKVEKRFTHTHILRVRYSETDQMGFCYYGNYATYLEVGRVEALRALGIAYSDLEKQGILLPVVHLSIDYAHPAKYDDELIIVTHLTELKGVKIAFDYEVYNEQKQKLCSAKTTLVFVNKATGKPMAVPHFLLDLFNRHKA